MSQDAYLRLVFYEAAENSAGWLLPLKDPRHPWHRLYARVHDVEAGGLEVLQEIQLLRDRVRELEEEVARLQAQRPQPARLPVI